MDDLLVNIPENPVPANTIAGMLDVGEGLRLRYARTAPLEGSTKGTIVILPGRNEFIEKYFETIADFTRRGYGTAILDWRGQGGSTRLLKNPDRGYVEDFRDYADDLDVFFQDVVLPDCRGPYHIVAHSMGALIALRAAHGLVNRVRRMVLCAPLLGIYASPATTRWVRRFAVTLHALGLGRLYMPGRRRSQKAPPFSDNALSTDEKRFERNRATVLDSPGLSINGPTIAWTRAMFKAIEEVEEPAFMAQIHIPTLFLAAGYERVVSTRAIERYVRRLRSASMLTIDGGRHELLQEKDFYREQALAAISAFFDGDGSQHF
ncbi:alpha/beta hydrolase [Nitratireductor indicus C115]|uniref:Alpha/beta hydrolase n=1 Tax=Nitratireductor indicus C115 TaxID=1231190 RepID=K2NX25_9HYPH|nr:alpha/beta hydrolase [Nitratireductor indicus]EKF42424.1 alpha/beta hydrolase [Nitratireductor indicus C115]SFQ55843.1 lysophospholipase [Nitratireductor indicus]